MESLINYLMDAAHSVSKKTPQAYSDLETTVGDRTLVYRNQTMATVVEFGGIKRVVGRDETDLISARLAEALNPFFARECHEIQFVFNRDLMLPEQMKHEMAPVYASAKALNMLEVIGDVLDEQAETMASVCMQETMVFVLYTHPKSMRPEEMKDWAKVMVERRRNGEFFCPPGTMDETFGIEPMLALHNAYVDQVVSALSDSDIGGSCEVLSAAKATGVIAHMLDPLGTPASWKAWLLPHTAEEARTRFATRRDNDPLLVGSPKRVRDEKPRITKVGNLSIYLPPPLKEQLIPTSANYYKEGVEINGRIYASLYMHTAPRRDVTSQQLIYNLSTMRARHGGVEGVVPYRLTMRMRAAGLSAVQMKAMIAPLFLIGGQNNKKIMKAYEALQHDKNKDLALSTFSLSLVTWVNVGEAGAKDLLKSRVVALRNAAQAWGDMKVEEEVIDRVQAVLDSVPCITQNPVSQEGTGNLLEILPLIPWTRPASPLGKDGTEFYRTLDGSLMRTAAHSSVQDYWLETMTAPMGGGKSAQANRKHFDFIFAPGRKYLPFLHCLDIGGSVAGMVHLCIDALPEDQKHLAVVHTLRNRIEDSVNMLDPKLGLRYPMIGDFQVSVEFLSALVTPPEREKPYDNMSEFCRAVLMQAYKELDDRNDQGSPKKYMPGQTDPDFVEIDKALRENSIDVAPGTPMYQVADMLAAKRLYHAASFAHRCASPTLPDLQRIARNDNVRAEFMRATTEQKIPIPEAFDTQLMLAMQSYPIFNQKTRLDFRSARITAIDLQEVARQGPPSARKQANLMYMVAYELFAKNIRITEEDLSEVPPVWMPYYRELLEQLQNTDKHVTIDEYHRTEINPTKTDEATGAFAPATSGIRATLEREGGRESRKWQLSLTTISQMSQDHGLLFNLASANHIIKRGSSEDTKFQAKHLGMSGADVQALNLFVNGPQKGIGVTFLSQWTTKAGKFNQLFTSTVGPKLLWSLSSGFEDKTIRSIVFKALGRQEGRTALAKMFPGGSAKQEVERRKLEVDTTNESDALAGASRLVAEEIIKYYRANRSAFQ